MKTMHPFRKKYIFQGLVNIRFAIFLPIVPYNSEDPVKMNTHLLIGIPSLRGREKVFCSAKDCFRYSCEHLWKVCHCVALGGGRMEQGWFLMEALIFLGKISVCGFTPSFINLNFSRISIF